MAYTFKIRTLGELSFWQGDDRVRIGGAREQALLIYLSFASGRPIARDVLTALLWDSGDDALKRHGLSQLLYRVRRLLPEIPISADRNSILLSPGSVQLDATELIDAVAGGRLEEACRLYRGRFAEHLFISGARDFDAWRDEIACRVDLAAGAALRARLRDADRVGNWQQADEIASQLLRLDPYDESVLAARIRAIAAAGDLTRAVKEAKQALETIRSEIGADAGNELQSLVARLSQSSEIGDSDVLEHGADVRFVGRATEFALLREVWRGTAMRRTSKVLLRGPAGIGKTRLCRQVLRLAAIEGARIFLGNCYEAGSQLPYGGVADLMVSGVTKQDLEHVPEVWYDPLAELLPEILPNTQSPGHPTQPTGDAGPRRLFEAIAQVFLGISNRSPVVLFLDDMQWADESTKAVVCYLARRLGGSRCMVLLALRPEEIATDSDLETSLELAGFETMPVGALEESDAALLLAALEQRANLTLNESTRRTVLERANGSPIFLVELVRLIAGTSDSSDGVELLSSSSSRVPAAIEVLFTRRINILGKAATRMAAALAVLGGKASLELVSQTSAVRRRYLADAVEELVRRGVVVEHEAELSFTHDLLREAINARLSDARRQWLNLRAASALRRSLSPHAGRIAIHLQAAGRPRHAFQYSLIAVAKSQQVFAHSESEFFLRLAIASAQTEQQRLRGLDLLCRHYYYTNQYVAVAEMMPDLRAWYTETGRREGLIMSAVVQMQRALASAELPLSELVLRARELNALFETVDDNTVISAGALGWIVETAHDAGQEAFILQLVQTVEESARSAKPDARQSQLLALCARANAIYRSAEAGCDIAEVALRFAQEVGDQASELIALTAYGTAATLRGWYSSATSSFERALGLSEVPGLFHYRQRILNNYGVLLSERGEMSRAKEVFRQALSLGSNHDRLFLYGNLGLIAVQEQRWAEVVEFAEKLLLVNRTLRAPWGEVISYTMLGYAALGRPDRGHAAEHARIVLEILEKSQWRLAVPPEVHILLVRSGVLMLSLRDTIDKLADWANGIRNRAAFSAARLDLERSRIMIPLDPDGAWRIARSVGDWAGQAGAVGVRREAGAIVSQLG